MEHAAQGVAAAISRHAPKSARVLFLCGPGNNGGDGYAAARLWCLGGGQADVWEVTSAVRGDALTNRTLALLHGVRVLPSADAVRTVHRLIMFESHLLPVIAVLAVFWARGW